MVSKFDRDLGRRAATIAVEAVRSRMVVVLPFAQLRREELNY
jgi:hypothetical protein